MDVAFADPTPTDYTFPPHPSSDRALLACSASAWAGDPTRCRWCDGELTGRRTRWCSNECANAFGRNHWWSAASAAAKRRDSHRCVECGSGPGAIDTGEWASVRRKPVRLEVHHRVPVLGRHDKSGCHHHLDGLVTLCAPCHLDAHRELRERERVSDGQLQITPTKGEHVTTATADPPAAEADIEAPEHPLTPPDPDANGQTRAFDPAMFEDPSLRIDKIDEKNVQAIAIAFSGRTMLDRTAEADVRLWNRLTIGSDVELRVSAKVVGLSGKGATNREGDLDVLVGTRLVKIDTIYVLTPEEL